MQPSGYGFKPNLFTPNNAAGLQLVPYTQPESTVSQNVPLTAEKLDNLYKMNYAVQPYPGFINPNAYAYNSPRPMAAPPTFYPASGTPTTFTPQHPTLQQPIESNNAANYNQSIASSSYSSASNTSQQYFNQNVINPQSALVHVPKVRRLNRIVFYTFTDFCSFFSCHPNKV